MKSEVVLSICIATYNHGQEQYKKVLEILSYTGNDIELIISDNCSTDDTSELLGNIKDPRFKFLKNTQNKGPTSNYIKALANGSGKYVMFVTDKDFIHIDTLDSVLQILEKNEFSLGYFTLNNTQQDIDVKRIFSRNECLLNFAYLSKHPTGYFYNNKYLKSLDIENRFENTDLVGSFPFEFICAELSIFGNGAIISLPFCDTAKTPIDCSSRSFTYSEKNSNLFFEPHKRFEMFEKYVSHLKTLSIPYIERRALLKKLILDTHSLSTNTFQSIKRNNALCAHYGTSTEKISAHNIKELSNEFTIKLRNSNALKIFSPFDRYIFYLDFTGKNSINHMMKSIKYFIKQYLIKKN